MLAHDWLIAVNKKLKRKQEHFRRAAQSMVAPSGRKIVRGCSDKIKYGGRAAAEKKVVELQAESRKPKADASLHSYYCERCGFHHVGHSSARKAKPIADRMAAATSSVPNIEVA